MKRLLNQIASTSGVKMSIIDLVSVREITKDDVNFILDSAITSLSTYKESITKGMTKQDMIDWLEVTVLYILKNRNYQTFIACDREDSSLIRGYIVSDPSKNHILLQYTKYNYRPLKGIQKYLLLPLAVDITKPISVEWPTKEMLRLAKQGKVEIKKLLQIDIIDRLTELETYVQDSYKISA